MKSHSRRYIQWLFIGVSVLTIFFFFFKILPYHLFHREQSQLFLFSSNFVLEYLKHPGALANLSGDFFTQFFYYQGVGPAIMAIVLLLWGVVVFYLLFPYMRCWAWLIAILAVLWETGRECGLNYPLSGTITLIGIGGAIWLCHYCIKRSWKLGLPLSFFILALSYWAFGYGNWTTGLYNFPNLKCEYLLALDSEMYFGRWQNVRKLLAKDKLHAPLVTYYYNLLNAEQNQLSDKLMNFYQPASQGLFLTVAPTSTYVTIFAANEVWFALGDMTMAEHATILGMIFSPHHTGVRAIKRLAEINLINGDEAAAMKYLRLLRKTLCYRGWVEHRIPGRQSLRVIQWLEQKRELLSKSDILRTANNIPLSLRHLLHSNSANSMARDYLLCFDLLNKDIAAFAMDYQQFSNSQIPCRLYSEALLIYLAGKGASIDEASRWNIPSNVLDEFKEYTRLYESNNGVLLQAKYKKTYWFYFHYASMKK